MSATVLYMSMSLDGFVAGPNESVDKASAMAASACTSGSSPAPRPSTGECPAARRASTAR
jgi:hypothetical protein